MKTFEERYENEILTDNTAIEKCKQCKDCIFQSDGTAYSNDYQKGSCAMYKYPTVKPLDVIRNTGQCEYHETS